MRKQKISSSENWKIKTLILSLKNKYPIKNYQCLWLIKTKTKKWIIWEHLNKLLNKFFKKIQSQYKCNTSPFSNQIYCIETCSSKNKISMASSDKKRKNYCYYFVWIKMKIQIIRENTTTIQIQYINVYPPNLIYWKF